MGDTLAVYNLGDMGIDVDTTPLHQSDGELINAQNAMFDVAGNKGGLRKRFGLTKLNSGSLSGAIMGAFDIPLQDPEATAPVTGNSFAPGLYNEGGYYTIDGPTWQAILVPGNGPPPILIPKFPIEPDWGVSSIYVCSRPLWAYAQGKAFTFTLSGGAGSQAGITRRLYGSDDVTALIPLPPQTGASSDPWASTPLEINNLNGTLYITVGDGGNDGSGPNRLRFLYGRVFSFDPVTEVLQQVGNAFGTNSGENTGGAPCTTAWYLGRLFVCTMPRTWTPYVKAKVYSIRPGIDETWTLETTFAADGLFPTNFAIYRDELYLGTVNAGYDADAVSKTTANAIILKRTPNGVWSTVRTGGGTLMNYYASLVAFNDKLYSIASTDVEGKAGATTVIEEYNGTAFSTSLNLFGASVFNSRETVRPGQAVVYKGSLYVATYASVSGDGAAGAAIQQALLRNNGSAWSIVAQSPDSTTPPLVREGLMLVPA